MKAKIHPQTVKQGILHFASLSDTLHPINPRMVESQTILGLSLVDSKPYSFFTTLTEVSQNASTGEIPTLVADRYLTGALAKSDLIDLYPYNIPFAKSVTISISESYLQITPGDWTATLKDLLPNYMCDYGVSVKVPLSMGQGILILRGHVAAARPSLPAIIGPTTQILLQKLPDNQLEKEQVELEHEKINRTEHLRTEIRQTLLHSIQQSAFSEAKATFDLGFDKSGPQSFDLAIIGLFTAYDIVEQQVPDMKKSTFSSSRTFVLHESNLPIQVVEYQLSATKNHGTLILRVKAPNPVRAEEEMKSFTQALLKVHDGLKKTKGKKDYEKRLRAYILRMGTELEETTETHRPLVALWNDVLTEFPDCGYSQKKFLKLVKKMQKGGLLSELQKLPTGYYMVLFHPLEMTQDPITILKYARTVSNGELTKEDLLTHLGWPEFRMEKALIFLVDRSLARLDTSYLRGKRYYFITE